MVYVDLDMFPATKIYRIPDDLPLKVASLAEPLTCTIRALNRAVSVSGFCVGDTVLIQGSGPIGALAIVAAKQMGAGRVVMIGAPEKPRLALCRELGADDTVCIEEHRSPQARIDAVRDIVGGFGVDVVMECSGHPSSGPEGIEMLRDGGTYVEMGQFTDAGSIETNWHRICAKDINVLGSWAFTPNDIPLGIQMLHRVRNQYPWHLLQTEFPFSEDGLVAAIDAAMAMRCVKATIVPAN
jgi:threonine dehydrogenase-like Zn-dependent dehydrogenase